MGGGTEARWGANLLFPRSKADLLPFAEAVSRSAALVPTSSLRPARNSPRAWPPSGRLSWP
jgi:hypothetical protein